MTKTSKADNQGDVCLHIVTPIHGKLTDLSKLETTRSASKGLPVKFIYVIDTDSGKDFERIHNSLSLTDLKRVKVIQADVESPGLARNVGLETVTSGWVCFWDADDLPAVSKFYEMVRIANQEMFSICAGGYETLTVDGITGREYLLPQTSQSSLIEIGINPGLWRFAFKRETIGELKFSSYRMAEDQLFLAEVNFDEIYIFEDIVYKYRIDQPGQLTRNKEALKDIVFVYKEMYEKLIQRKIPHDSFRILMLTRQLLTGIKYLPLNHKFNVILFMCKVIIQANGFRAQIFKSLVIILAQRKAH
jgi:hypothetical protein